VREFCRFALAVNTLQEPAGSPDHRIRWISASIAAVQFPDRINKCEAAESADSPQSTQSEVFMKAAQDAARYLGRG
jgi:hypothetical protein